MSSKHQTWRKRDLCIPDYTGFNWNILVYNNGEKSRKQLSINAFSLITSLSKINLKSSRLVPAGTMLGLPIMVWDEVRSIGRLPGRAKRVQQHAGSGGSHAGSPYNGLRWCPERENILEVKGRGDNTSSFFLDAMTGYLLPVTLTSF